VCLPVATASASESRAQPRHLSQPATSLASKENPGPWAGGCVLKSSNGEDMAPILIQGAEYAGRKTNNEAEYCGLILGLHRARPTSYTGDARETPSSRPRSQACRHVAACGVWGDEVPSAEAMCHFLVGRMRCSQPATQPPSQPVPAVACTVALVSSQPVSVQCGCMMICARTAE
jgi:hypothetical protein